MSSRLFGIFTFTFALVGGSFAADKPNVLMVITDEHNFRTLGCYRQQMSKDQAEMWGPGAVVETPNIDRLADEGVICTRAYATSPVCTPSRAAMITGRYPHNTGSPQNNLALKDDVPTLATILNARGYRTSFVGKWHLGGQGKPEWAPRVDGGFQHKTSMFNRGHWKKFKMTTEGPAVAPRNNKGEPTYDVANADEKNFSTDFLTDRLLEFVGSKDDRPFFAVVSYPDPHGPNTVRTPYDHMYDDLRFLPPRTYGRDDMPIPGWLAGGKKQHAKFRGEQMSKYFGMVKCIDDNFGRILSALQESQQLDSTIILLTSDHGDLCYEHDRLNKGNPYEGSARVPMLIRYPSRLSSGMVYRQPFGTIDITPTILGLAKVDCDVRFEGRDLNDRFSGSETTEITFLRNAGTSAGWIAAIDNRYKLILSVRDKPWLMDAETDPDELLNFFGRPGTEEVTNRLAKALLDYTRQTKDPYADNATIAESIKVCLETR